MAVAADVVDSAPRLVAAGVAAQRAQQRADPAVVEFVRRRFAQRSAMSVRGP